MPASAMPASAMPPMPASAAKAFGYIITYKRNKNNDHEKG
jgi:hypothetical protein